MILLLIWNLAFYNHCNHCILRHEKEIVKKFTHMTVFVDFLFTEMPNGKVLTFTS